MRIINAKPKTWTWSLAMKSTFLLGFPTKVMVEVKVDFKSRGKMTIGDVAARSGIAASAIRYYESVGLLASPVRVSGRRVYSPDVLNQLTIITFAKETGFRLPEIKLLLRGFPEGATVKQRWRKLAVRKSEELDRSLSKMRTMKTMLKAVLSCRCKTLEQCALSITHKL